MLQYFPDHRYRSTFCKNSSPRLEYVCHVGTDASHMPRSMHEHDHLCELLLVSQGAGIYMIDGRRYTAQKGNLIIYNSRTVHDEFGGSGSNLVTYCIAIGGLRIDGLPADHLLPDGYCPVQPLRQHFAEKSSRHRHSQPRPAPSSTKTTKRLYALVTLRLPRTRMPTTSPTSSRQRLVSRR